MITIKKLAHTVVILEFCSLEVRHRSHQANIKVLTGMHFFLESLRVNLFPCLFWLLESTRILWLRAPSCIFKGKHIELLWPLFCISISFWLSSVSFFYLWRPYWLHCSPSPYYQGDLLTSLLAALLLWATLVHLGHAFTGSKD